MYQIFAMKISELKTDTARVLLRTGQGKPFFTTYYFWLLKGDDHTILVDTGISQDGLSVRGISGPSQEEILSRINIRPDSIDTVIQSHLHNDHFSNPEIYTNAMFYVQRKEVEYWSGEVQGFPILSRPGFLKGRPTADIAAFQKLNMAGRVRFLDGDSEIYPGVNTILMGGHTPGLQTVHVATSRGPVLLCIDFIVAYLNLEERVPIATYTSMAEWIAGINRIERMGLPPESKIPGHDSLVMSKFPGVADGIVRIA